MRIGRPLCAVLVVAASATRSARTAAEFETDRGWPWDDGFTGCRPGQHKVMNRRAIDPHPPGVNPNCRAYDDDLACEEEQAWVVLDQRLELDAEISADCSDLVRGPALFDFDAELWDFQDTLGMDHLYGRITVGCSKDSRNKPQLRVVRHNCRELLPFSVVDAFDPSEVVRTAPLKWETRGATGPWADKEIKHFNCGVAPASIILSSNRGSKDLAAAFISATTSCAADERCKAVGIEKATGRFHLLSKFHCEYGAFSKYNALEVGQKVKWRGWPAEAPSQKQGVVTRRWDISSSRELVDVSYRDIEEIQHIHISNLEVVDSEAPWTVAVPLRDRVVACDKLQAKYSCDIPERNDAAILFRDGYKTMADCREACRVKSLTTRFRLGWKGCCVFTEGVCALTQGELFKLQEDDYSGVDSESPFTQKRYLQDPDALEAAGFCYEQPCADDPLCSFDGSREFAPPEDVTTDEVPGRVTVYFDFAHPLSLPFAAYPGEDGTHIFHFSSLQQDAVNAAKADKRRWLRTVGTVPATAPVLKSLALPNVDQLVAGRKLKRAQNASNGDGDSVSSNRTGAKPLSNRPVGHNKRNNVRQTGTPKPHEDLVENVNRTGYTAVKGRASHTKFTEINEVLDRVCKEHGARLKRDLRAPILSLFTRGECLRLHTNVNSPFFEPCMIQQGCSDIDKEARWVPFHGPYFSKLQFDLLAWQQPAPFCCGVPYNDDRRDEKIFKQFLQDIEFQDPNSLDLSTVENEAAKETMRETLSDGSRAMKKLLAYDVHDEGTIDWLAGFVQSTTQWLSNYIEDLQQTVDSEGDEVEVSEDGTEFLQLHEEGSHVTPEGRRAFPIARWSEDRGAFIQLRPPNSTIGKLWTLAKQIPGAIYNYGMKPVWNYVMKPLMSWGFSIAKWVVEHPRAALFISKLALAIRDRLCEKASFALYEMPETQAIGAFGAASKKMSETTAYFKDTFSPAVLLVFLQKSMGSTELMARMKSLGSAAFGIVMAWAGVATGGAAMALVGSVTSLLADAAIDASKQALEFMIYKEIAKEIPSNLFDMVFKKCLYKREAETEVTIGATLEEVKGAAETTLREVTRQVTATSSRLVSAMSGFAGFFTGSGSSLAEFHSNHTLLLHRLRREPSVLMEM